MFGRQCVIDAEAAQAGALGDLAGEAVVDVDIAHDPAAAVDQHDTGRRRLRAGIIEAEARRAARHGDDPLFDMGERRRAGVEIEGEAGIDSPELVDRDLGWRRQAAQLTIDPADHESDLWIERAPRLLEQGEEGLGFGFHRRVTLDHDRFP